MSAVGYSKVWTHTAFRCVAAPRARSAAHTHGFDAAAYARRASRASLRTVNAKDRSDLGCEERSDLGSVADGKSRTAPRAVSAARTHVLDVVARVQLAHQRLSALGFRVRANAVI